MSRDRAASFTGRVLAEVAPHLPPLTCCRYALIDGIRLVAAPHDPVRESGGEGRAGFAGAVMVLLDTPRSVTARAARQTLGALGVSAHVERRGTGGRVRHAVVGEAPWVDGRRSPGACCSRTLLRGAVLAGGSVARPEAPPQAEIACGSAAAAVELLVAAAAHHLEAGMVMRRGRAVVTLRSAASVAALISTIGAQAARLAFEEGRVEGEIRSAVNRHTNAETANLRRTVAGGLRQVAAARLLQSDPVRWQALPRALREAAVLRQRRPADTLERLAQRASVSRSAMAGRLHRLVALAQQTVVASPRRRGV